MGVIVLPAILETKLKGVGKVRVEGTTVHEAICQLELKFPELAGWILNERGFIRERVRVFVNKNQADRSQPVSPDDYIYIVPWISASF